MVSLNTDETSSDSEEDSNALGMERHLVLIVILFVICLTGFLAVTSAQANSEVLGKNAKSEQEPYRPDFKPPVAKPVVLPLPLDQEVIERISKEWGIQIISLTITANGYMMDFRFKVVDEKKSKIFFDHRIKPTLIVEKSNAVLPVPMAAKVGAFRPTNRGGNIKAGKIYYIVFGNPDSHVKSGDKVTMVFGDFKAEGMTVH